MSAMPKDEAKRRLQPVPAPTEQPQEEKPRRKYYRFSEISKIPPPRWLFQNKLLWDSVALLVGAPGTGKTFLALDMALTLAAEGYLVLYTAGESLSQYWPRIEAWLETHPDAQISDDNFILVDNVPQLADITDDLPMFLNELDTEVGELRPALVVVDTLARATLGLSDTDDSDMKTFIAGCEQLREKYGCCVLLIHHTPISDPKRPKGSQALPGGVETIFAMTKGEKRQITLFCVKQKNSEDLAPETYEFVKSRDSVVLERIEEPGETQFVENVKENIMRVLVILARDLKNGMTSGQLQALLDLKPHERRKFQGWLTEAKLGDYVSQKGKAQPYFITKKGLETLPSKFKRQEAIEILKAEEEDETE